MAARWFMGFLAAPMMLVACGSVGPDWGFKEDGDWDIGQGSSHGDTDDAGTAAVDPCADPSALLCNPLDNAGCDGEAEFACAYHAAAAGGEGSFECLSDSTEPEGAACDEDDGPWCGPALLCVPRDGSSGVCARACCDDEDCSADTGSCAPVAYPNVEGPFGACAAPTPGDAGATDE